MCRPRCDWPLRQGLLGHMGVEDVSYFLSTTRIGRTDAPNMSAWRKWLFVTMAHNKADEALHFGSRRTSSSRWVRGRDLGPSPASSGLRRMRAR